MTVSSAAPNGALLIVMNAGSGHNDHDAVLSTIKDVLERAGRAYRLIMVEDPALLVETARRTAAEAVACGGAVVVAGGDGTINAVAGPVLASGCPLGVLPLGTFNYFARAHGIPEDTTEAVETLLHASPCPVQVGLVNERLFLVNASIGLYRQLLEEREAFQRHFGRSRLIAFWSGLRTLLRHHRQLRLTLEGRGQTTSDMRTLTLFVGNNPLQIEQLGIPLTEAVEQGQLAAIALRPVGVLAMMGLVLRGAIGRLGDADKIVSFGFSRLSVKPSSLYGRRDIKVAIDGEVFRMTSPLEFRVSPLPLYLLKPDSRESVSEMPKATSAASASSGRSESQ